MLVRALVNLPTVALPTVAIAAESVPGPGSHPGQSGRTAYCEALPRTAFAWAVFDNRKIVQRLLLQARAKRSFSLLTPDRFWRERPELARTVIVAARQFGSDPGETGLVADMLWRLSVTDTVEKVGGMPSARNNRIVIVDSLNRSSAFDARFESILL